MNRYFITGTDTDCGKTYVCLALLKWYKKMQRKAHALKPVAAGQQVFDGFLCNEDVLALQKETAYPELPINAFSFKEALSPHLSAKRAGSSISIESLIEFCEQPAFYPVDNLIIEGAGGLMVPLNDKECWLDFLRLSKIPVVLVVGLRLGCLNHALLTAAVLKAEGIACLGWIANHLDKNMLALEENKETLVSWLELPLLGMVSHEGGFKMLSPSIL